MASMGCVSSVCFSSWESGLPRLGVFQLRAMCRVVRLYMFFYHCIVCCAALLSKCLKHFERRCFENPEDLTGWVLISAFWFRNTRPFKHAEASNPMVPNPKILKPCTLEPRTPEVWRFPSRAFLRRGSGAERRQVMCFRFRGSVLLLLWRLYLRTFKVHICLYYVYMAHRAYRAHVWVCVYEISVAFAVRNAISRLIILHVSKLLGMLMLFSIKPSSSCSYYLRRLPLR